MKDSLDNISGRKGIGDGDGLGQNIETEDGEKVTSGKWGPQGAGRSDGTL